MVMNGWASGLRSRGAGKTVLRQIHVWMNETISHVVQTVTGNLFFIIDIHLSLLYGKRQEFERIGTMDRYLSNYCFHTDTFTGSPSWDTGLSPLLLFKYQT